jgi:post-segregation antitoxin (ccd killing protein)
MTDEERRKAHMVVGALAVQIDGDLLNKLGDVAGQISDEEVKERLAAYVIITALASDKAERTVEVSATVMISLLAEIRRWRARYRVPEQPVQ